MIGMPMMMLMVVVPLTMLLVILVMMRQCGSAAVWLAGAREAFQRAFRDSRHNANGSVAKWRQNCCCFRTGHP